MKFEVNGSEVFASTGGRPFDKNKPLIIFVHGSGLTHMTWVLQTRYFAFHGYSVLALDMPGQAYPMLKRCIREKQNTLFVKPMSYELNHYHEQKLLEVYFCQKVFHQ